MLNYDWIIIGAGISGSALSYELAKQGFKVLLLEKDDPLHNATVYSYGGIAYWSGTTKLTCNLCQESRELYPNLSAELESDIEFREIDLLLTIEQNIEPQQIFANYKHFYLEPQLLDAQESYELEPLLNREAISGSLKLPHGHVNPQKMNSAYQKAFTKLGGQIEIEAVINLLKTGNNIEGVRTTKNYYYGKNTVVCTGGLTRQLLQENGLKIPIYFTHAQLIKIPPVDLKLRTLIMSGKLERLLMEQEIIEPKNDYLWQNPRPEILSHVMEAGGVQFLDGSICLGQISEIITDPQAKINPVASENEIRKKVGTLLPLLSNLSGTWHNCLVAFSNPSNFLVGKLANFERIYVFSGFTSPFVYVPTLARHFANYAMGKEDLVMSQLSNRINSIAITNGL
jgi:glycine/D-amino acid oxidase-like deaminating enzyme